MIRPAIPNRDVLIIGFASILDGLIAIVSIGFLLGDFRHAASLAAARKEYQKRERDAQAGAIA